MCPHRTPESAKDRNEGWSIDLRALRALRGPASHSLNRQKADWQEQRATCSEFSDYDVTIDEDGKPEDTSIERLI